MKTIFRFLRRQPKGPWSDWLTCEPRPVCYDVRSRALEGIAFGADVHALEGLGKPTEVDLENACFAFAPLGLVVEMDNDEQVFGFSCVFAQAHSIDLRNAPGFQPCELTIRLGGGRDWHLRAGLERGDVDRLATGLEQEELFADEVESCYSVTLGSTAIILNYDADNRLTRVDLELEESATAGA